MVRRPTQPSPSRPVYLTLHGDNHTSQTNHTATPYHEVEGIPKQATERNPGISKPQVPGGREGSAEQRDRGRSERR